MRFLGEVLTNTRKENEPQPKSRPDSIAESSPGVLLEGLCSLSQDLRAGKLYLLQ